MGLVMADPGNSLHTAPKFMFLVGELPWAPPTLHGPKPCPAVWLGAVTNLILLDDAVNNIDITICLSNLVLWLVLFYRDLCPIFRYVSKKKTNTCNFLFLSYDSQPTPRCCL